MTARRTRTAPRTGYIRLVRAADEVSVYAGAVGFVKVTKKAATRLLREKGGKLTAEFVPDLGLLLLTPSST